MLLEKDRITVSNLTNFIVQLQVSVNSIIAMWALLLYLLLLIVVVERSSEVGGSLQVLRDDRLKWII